MKTIDRCFLTVLAFFCALKVCELCRTIRASRGVQYVPEGGSTKMSCDVEHCGVVWTGGWAFQDLQSPIFTSLVSSSRIKLSSYSLTANSTRLLVHLQNINQSDAGAYKCMIVWSQNISSNGHVTYINVTEATAESSGRKFSHRVLVCLCAFICFPLVLGLVWCRTQNRPSAPPLPPHPRISRAERIKLKQEVVYAEVALNDAKAQNHPPKQVTQPTIYSSLHFK